VTVLDRALVLVCLVAGVALFLSAQTSRSPGLRTIGTVLAAAVVWCGVLYAFTILTAAAP